MTTGQPKLSCRWDGCERDDLSPQGHKSHETHCDHNPNPGISYTQQQDLGLLDEEERATPNGGPNPDQSVSEPSGGLPSVERLSPDKNPTEKVATDGGKSECPLCGHGDVLDAAEAKTEYVEAVEKPHPKAVLGYELADQACQNPECAALWGEKYHEPLPMEEVVNA